MAKIEPAVTQLTYVVPSGDSYIDIAKDLSKVNRRLYRQGYTYVVQDVQVGLTTGMQVTDIQQFTFATAGNSYVVHNAWSKGFKLWRSQQREILRALPGIQGKWADFKVYLDDVHEDSTILEPYAGDAAVYLAGEWEHSKIVFDDDGTERELKMHLIGSSNLADTNNESGIGLIHEYQISTRRPQDPEPDVPADASNSIYAKILGTDEMSDMMVDNIEGDNDSSPYDDVEMPGGATNADTPVLVRIGAVSANQSVGRFGGFIAPCGLLKVSSVEMQLDGATPAVYEQTGSATAVMIVTLAAGPYRGVLAAPMGQ